MRDSRPLALIAFLFCLPTPSWADKAADADFLQCCYNIRNMSIACEMYSTDYRGQYPTKLSVLTPNYLKRLPKCPVGKTSYRYKVDEKDVYLIQCAGKHHKAAGIGANQPFYTGRRGFRPDSTRNKYKHLKLQDRPNTKNKRRKSTPATACRSNLKNLATALEMYGTDHKGRYPRTLKPLVPNYLRNMLACPSARRDTYSATYKVGPKLKSYSFRCSGHHHKSENYPANFPAYDSVKGLKTRP